MSKAVKEVFLWCLKHLRGSPKPGLLEKALISDMLEGAECPITPPRGPRKLYEPYAA
jgi:hypothetical protein